MIFGVLPQKKNQYALRILGNCGEFTSEELLRLSELTAKFGNGKITATSIVVKNYRYRQKWCGRE